MNHETMKILSILEKGKISVNEAERLLSILGNQHKHGHHSRRHHEEDFDYVEVEDEISEFADTIEDFAKEVNEKIDKSFKNVEPKLKGLRKVVLEKTAFVVDEVSKALNETIKNFENEEQREKVNEDDNTPRPN